MEMLQLVRVTHDIDCDNLIISDLERGGLEDVFLLDSDESWQTVDKAVLQKPGSHCCKYKRQFGVEPDDRVETNNRVWRSRDLSTAVGISDDIFREERSQLLHVAVARRREERVRDLETTFLQQWKAWACRTDVLPGTTGELAACRGFATDRLGDFLKVEPEYVMEEKGGAFQGRQTLQRHHQWQREIIKLLFCCFDDRFRQPWPDIGLTPISCRFQLIKTKTGHDAAEICLRLSHRVAINIEPAEERLLDHIFGIRN